MSIKIKRWKMMPICAFNNDKYVHLKLAYVGPILKIKKGSLWRHNTTNNMNFKRPVGRDIKWLTTTHMWLLDDVRTGNVSII